MFIQKVIITNFKCFSGRFEIELSDGVNIIVGDNEAGKSTILEAIHLALSGWIYGKYLPHELSQFLFNSEVVATYLEAIGTERQSDPPEILIELFFEIEDESLAAIFEGDGNSLCEKASGVQFRICFNEKHRDHYSLTLQSGQGLSSLPIEYYDFHWSTFARDSTITPRNIPFRAALIDSSNTRLRNGSDVYISRIMRDFLSEEHKIEISQAHRELRDAFANCSPIKEVNALLAQQEVSKKIIELSVDLSTKDVWETGITTYLDEIPFSNVGKGEQCLVKTKLALSHRQALEASVLLLEEPENHLSHGKLNELLRYINDNREGRQVLVSTHSSFVANKLGLSSLILLNIDAQSKKRRQIRLLDLDEGTTRFFQKLAGYDTLRLILCKSAILVEGPSDELVIQKAYMRYHDGRLPIEDGIDVISVGTSFIRFLEIADELGKPVCVVTDNDGNYQRVLAKYKDYREINLCVDSNEKFKTLEPQMVEANRDSLDLLRRILGIKEEYYPDQAAIAGYMENNKTESALKLFETECDLNFPSYILKAVGVIDAE